MHNLFVINKINVIVFIASVAFVVFINTVFILVFDNDFKFQLLTNYIIASVIIFLPILFYRCEKSKFSETNLLFFLSLLGVLFYYSSGLPLLSDTPEFTRISVFKKWGPLNRLIILIWQFAFVLAFVLRKKPQIILLSFFLLMTGFRSLIFDTILIALLLDALYHRRINYQLLFVAALFVILVVSSLTYIRFGNIEDISFLLDAIAYTQTYNVAEILSIAKNEPVNAFLIDLKSVFLGGRSYAEQYTHSVGNDTGQTAAVSHYGYVNNYESPLLMTLLFSGLMLLQLLIVRFFSINLGIFMCWIFARATLSHGPGLPIAIHALLALIFVFGVIFCHILLRQNFKLQRGKII